ncbi:hypothetical protein JX265_013959 [Neoarthrinium moseri]|uniref:Rhodopsin domain-containing protein n=2 Tax=Neoarthrinium moseri TaxID=1658444 RepID=A0A9P9W7H7_9PEZI|nr:hypothetical protein JX266_014168 [Neoarthrinium moseri]KAI1847467.1 hypothetical protein JX265_013959 [Neoarthrinium moseri]
MIKSFGVDDWLMLIAMFFFTLHTGFCLGGVAHGTGQHAVDLTASDITLALQNWWFCYLWYCATMIFSKASIAFFLLRLTPIWSQRVTIYATLGVSTLISVAFFFVAMLQCLPVSFFWTRLAGTGSYFTFTFLPVWLVKGLQVDKSTKFALVPILSLGATASCAVAVRLAYIQSFRDSDFLCKSTPAWRVNPTDKPWCRGHYGHRNMVTGRARLGHHSWQPINTQATLSQSANQAPHYELVLTERRNAVYNKDQKAQPYQTK